MPKILIAGGGSGGHVAPAIAAAESLSTLNFDCVLAHSNREIDSMMASQTPFNCITLPASPLSLKPSGFKDFCVGFRRTRKQVSKFIQDQSIDCVLATGGFVAAPSLCAAKSRSSNCSTVLLNLDNPPGKANRLAVRWADRILSTVQCNLKNASIIPPPLRQCVIAKKNTKKGYEHFGLDPHRMTLLVTGASQGASSLNKFIPALAKQYTTSFKGWQVLHIAGAGHSSAVTDYWSSIDIPCQVIGFEQNMGLAWGVADFAITRGGANTVAELAINAIPAVVLPYPYHRDDHQRTNALPLQLIGGIRIEKDYVQTDLNIEHAGVSIIELLRSHRKRFEMQQALASQLPSNGATEIAHACVACIESGLPTRNR